MARLLAELVQDVRDARVGEVLVAQDLEREPGREHGFEADAVGRDRRDLLARQRRPLLGGEVEVEAGDRQQLVGQDLARPDRAGDGLVGLDHPLQRERGEPLDPRSSVSGRSAVLLVVVDHADHSTGNQDLSQFLIYWSGRLGS